MLNEDQIKQIWENMISAETRALYFADLARIITVRKQWITATSFFLASGAAAELIAKGPAWIAAASTGLVAMISAYSMAVNSDKNIATLTQLHAGWANIADDYQYLWNHVYSDDAESRMLAIQEQEKKYSEMAVSGIPYKPKRLKKWENHIFYLRNLSDQYVR